MNCFAVPYDPALLATAFVICFASAFGVFRLRARMRNTRGMVRAAWLLLCGLQAGSGVWATQFLAMGAADVGLASGYNPLALLLTLGISVIGVGLGLSVAWTGRDSMRTLAGGLLVAATIGATHFVGIGAWRVQAALAWEPIWVWLSVVSAAVLCVGSLFLAGRVSKLSQQAIGGGLLAAAIATLHFLGQRALSLAPDAHAAVSPDLLAPSSMTLIVVMLSVLMILGGLGAAYIDDMASRQAKKSLQHLADAAREGLVVLNADGEVRDCNAGFAELYGAPADEMVGLQLLNATLKLEGDEPLSDGRSRDAWLVSLHGERIPVEVHGRALADQLDDRTNHTILSVRDLREQRAAEDHIRFLAEHDSLTGLPNRVVLRRELEAASARIATSGEPLIMLCLRVENSKEINTALGHAAGDALLVKVGERLLRYAQNGAVAARLGGNEFALMVYGVKDADVRDFGPMLHALMASLRRRIVHESHLIEPQVSAGIAAIPTDCANIDELMMHAESALNTVDTAGAEGVAYFRQDLHDAMHQQRELVSDLRQAIDQNQLVVYYQPQARAEDGELCGFEALVRWTHPVRGFMSPDSFIPAAEASGLIAPMGEWVLRQACREAASWPKPVTIAVNLSPHQVAEADLPTKVHQILIETGLSPARLELEITESALFRDYQRALDVLRRLKALGVKIAMDDFGTGFSSLSTLQSFPFDKIKIDKSFVEGVGKLARSTVIVRAVLGIGRGLEIPVVAEGVETDEQMAFLRDEACASIQGYLIGRPGPVASHAALFDAAHGSAPAVVPKTTAAA